MGVGDGFNQFISLDGKLIEAVIEIGKEFKFYIIYQ